MILSLLRAAAAATLPALFLAGCMSSGSGPSASRVLSPSPVIPGLLVVHDPGQVTGTLAGPCHARGKASRELPDPRCTPGAIDTSVTAAVLCSGHYSTKSYRPPVYQTSRFKYEVAYPAYGLPSGAKTELDHLVSLELGGANDAANLWPEPPPSPNPKDAVENRLHSWVCAAAGPTAENRLRQAQLAIAGDWTGAEKILGITASAPGA